MAQVSTVAWVQSLAQELHGCGQKNIKGVPAVAQWVKDPVLLQLWQRLQMQLRFSPWPREIPYAMGVAEKGKKNYNPFFLHIKWE